MMTSSSYRIGVPLPTQREDPKYQAFLPLVDDMTYDEVSSLQNIPIVGPYAVHMEIYSEPEDSMKPATADPTNGDPYVCYRYSGSRKNHQWRSIRSEAKKITSLMESQKPKREHRS